VFCQKTESVVAAYLSTFTGRQNRPCYGASMRKSSILLIAITVCLMSASPSYAKKITYSNGIQTQSVLPTKGDKVKCGKYHSPLVKVPKFKLVKQNCEELYSGLSSMKFKADKIYRGIFLDMDIYKSDGLTHKPDPQKNALAKTLKNYLAKGWSLDKFEYGDSGTNPLLSSRLKYINKTTKRAIFADVSLFVEDRYTNYKTNAGESWVVISVSNLHEVPWE